MSSYRRESRYYYYYYYYKTKETMALEALTEENYYYRETTALRALTIEIERKLYSLHAGSITNFDFDCYYNTTPQHCTVRRTKTARYCCCYCCCMLTTTTAAAAVLLVLTSTITLLH